MNKKSIYAMFLAMITFSFITTSCMPDDSIPDVVNIELSSNSLVIDYKAQEPTSPQIVFNADDQAKVILFTTADWLDAKVESKGIWVRAKENKHGNERKATIIIFVNGNAVEKISVTQGPADLILDISPKSISIDSAEKELYVNVVSNSDDWLLVPSEYNWIQAVKVSDNQVKVTIQPNMSFEQRIGKVYLKVGSITKEVSVTQLGSGTAKYILPLLKRKASFNEIIEYEKTHGRTLMDYKKGSPGNPNDEYLFSSPSSIFPVIKYQRSTNTEAIVKISMESFESDALKTEEFMGYLEDNGFEWSEPNNKYIFRATHKESHFDLLIKYGKNIKEVTSVELIAQVVQDEAYPTFETFPYDKSSLLMNPHWTSAEIIKMEEESNHEVMVYKSNTKPALITSIVSNIISDNRQAPNIRAYLMDVNLRHVTTSGMAKQLVLVWEDYTLGLWKDGNVYHITREFESLLSGNGFEYFGMSVDQKPIYYNKEKRLAVTISGEEVPEDNYASTLRLQFFILD